MSAWNLEIFGAGAVLASFSHQREPYSVLEAGLKVPRSVPFSSQVPFLFTLLWQEKGVVLDLAGEDLLPLCDLELMILPLWISCFLWLYHTNLVIFFSALSPPLNTTTPPAPIWFLTVRTPTRRNEYIGS